MSIVGHAPIHKSVLSKEPRKVDALNAILENRAKPNTLDSNGWTALHHACYEGDRVSADILIKNDADVNSFSNLGKTPLHMAAMRNHTNCIELLLQPPADIPRNKKAKIEAKDELGCTPLHLGCKKGSYDAVCLLLALGCDPYALDHRGWTPLHYAAYNGEPKIAKKLLTWTADTDPKLRNARNSQNRTAFNISKNPETKLGFRIVWKAAKEGDLDMVRILTREG